jgi:hypothetical protein
MVKRMLMLVGPLRPQAEPLFRSSSKVAAKLDVSLLPPTHLAEHRGVDADEGALVRSQTVQVPCGAPAAWSPSHAVAAGNGPKNVAQLRDLRIIPESSPWGEPWLLFGRRAARLGRLPSCR